LGDIEGIKARLQKRLGNDELLKVGNSIINTIVLIDRSYIVFFTSAQERLMKSKGISETSLDSTLQIRWTMIPPCVDIRILARQCVTKLVN
jgi:hypothetical protein